MEGYFKVHRKILDSQVFAHQTALKIWIWCLARVTFKERFVSVKISKGETAVKLQPGQFIFGRFKAEEELDIDGSTIYKWMQKFASPEYEMITIESNSHYSIITLCNWEQYQNEQETEVTAIEQPRDSHGTATEQPRNTNNNDNNDKNISLWRSDFDVYLKECKEGYAAFMTNPELIKTQQKLNPGVNVKLSIEKGFVNFWGTEAGWKYKKGKKSKTIDWMATIKNSIAMNKVYYTKEELAKQ